MFVGGKGRGLLLSGMLSSCDACWNFAIDSFIRWWSEVPLLMAVFLPLCLWFCYCAVWW